MKSDLLCFIPEYLCSGFAEHIFKGVGCCAIILFQGVGVDVHGRGSLCVTQLYCNFQYKIRKPTKGVGRKYYRQIVIYGGMQRISSFTIRFLGWMI